MSRMLRFVQAARALLWMQVAAAVIATALGVWAVVAVRDLAIERDQLLGEVAELRRAGPSPSGAATPNGPAPSALDSEVRAPAIMPIFIPIVQPSEGPPIPPVDIPPPDKATGDPPPDEPPPTDCNSPNADPRRCRPDRWRPRNPPVVVRPVPTVRDQPQRPNPAAPQP
jgi:hypothetical protein